MSCLRSFTAAMILALSAPSLVARADENTHVAALLELFEAMDTERILDTSIEQSMDLQIKVNPALAEGRPILREFFRKYVSYDSLKGDMVRTYMKAITESETRELLAFYKTPIGRKSISVLPKLMSQMSDLGMNRVMSHLPELRKMVADHEAAKNKSSSAPATQPAASGTAPKKPAAEQSKKAPAQPSKSSKATAASAPVTKP